MEICRACLLTEQDMVPLDDFCVTNYNLLTNLQISLDDKMPHFFCQNCFNMVKVFADFREKAIMSETSLREITKNNIPGDLLQDDKYADIKKEIYQPDNDQDCNDSVFCTEGYDNGSCDNNFDVKYQLLQCGLCKGEFIDNLSFLEHLKQHKKGGRCKLCFEKVKIVDLYAHTLTHLQTIVNPENGLESKEGIKLELSDVDYLAASVAATEKKERKTKVKKKSKQYAEVQSLLACGLCKMLFDCNELLVQHLESHKLDGNSCKICLETFTCWPQLFGHRIEHVPKKQRHCHVCKYRNHSQSAMEYHYKMLHYDGEDKHLTCKHCSRTYATPRQLSRHTHFRHGTKRYICDYCSKSHHSKQSLRIHIASHLQIRPYMCDQCGFASKLKTGLTNHKLRKHDPRSVSCKLCSMVFVEHDKFHRHNCNPTSVVCPQCGKEFVARKSLARHLKTHAEARFACAACAARYRSGAGLRAHEARHAGRRPLRCERCPARFYSAPVLLKHRRTHTGEKPYVCRICHRGFTGGNNLKVHMRIHGEDLIVKRDKTSIKPNPFIP